MMNTAGIESVLGSRRTPIRSLLFLSLWSVLAFSLAGVMGTSLGAWTPDVGVVLLIALVARSRPRGLWAAAIAISAGRIALSIEPPLAILAIYLGIAGVHSGLCGFADGNRALVRFFGAALYAGITVVALIALHESRSVYDLGLLEHAPQLAMRTAASTAMCSILLSPLLSLLPGLGEWRQQP
ncbi:MAG: hypothetical protein ACI8TQ_003066 [Planctomycetota bacterium]|jgi:hypothetical protein